MNLYLSSAGINQKRFLSVLSQEHLAASTQNQAFYPIICQVRKRPHARVFGGVQSAVSSSETSYSSYHLMTHQPKHPPCFAWSNVRGFASPPHNPPCACPDFNPTAATPLRPTSSATQAEFQHANVPPHEAPGGEVAGFQFAACLAFWLPGETGGVAWRVQAGVRPAACLGRQRED